ncbi:zonadhesin-like isoform X2 [Microplitis mediator]|uniref:zonadhesin-like isoform X2 n=1 Tax=Microplitis mediator TaxID=375433 RepID=UPI002555CB33|nr:zonadhesin-like isoform X2 [Microplitis mediator]
MSNYIVLIVVVAVIGLAWVEAMPTKDSDRVQEVATEDADSVGQSHTDSVCSENEHYNNTREDCEEHCQGGPVQNFCWCNKGYIRDSSWNCMKIEDCPKDEKLKSGTMTSSGDNVFSMVSNVKKAATEDADSSGSSHTHGVCSENEHYNNTREDCEEHCQGGPVRVCSGVQNFCWCNKGYIRDSSWNCMKIEDCPKDEKLKSGTMTSSGDNVFSMVSNVKKAATEDADSSGSSHTHGVCSENEHYNNTREDCEEHCQGGPVRVCSGVQNFCWCNKGYIRDSSWNCMKIEDCPKDEKLKSGTMTSSGDNVFSMVSNVKKAATEDADSSGSSHTHGVCSENEHYNNTREDCEEHCQGGPVRVCSGVQNFCWCNKGYIRDSSWNCMKIEDCPKDEKLKSGTMTSSGDNVFSMVSNVKKAATEDADSSGSSHTHGVCSENEHYNNTREDCEEHCQGGPVRVCSGVQNFCWCNKGYIRDSSWNCMKIEDCPKDEKLKSGTMTSSGDNVFSMVSNVKKAATEDADSSGSSHTHGVCSENEHYNNTREDCEEHCQGGPVRVCSGVQNFCWCNKGYIRDSSWNCMKIEDCPKDEKLKSGTMTSSGDNVFSMVSNVKKAATEDADSSGSSHTHGVCSENEHYNNTREDCEEHCQGGPVRVCSGVQNFCWCNKGYIRDSSWNCMKIEDCPKDEKLKSGTMTSSGDNVFSMVSNVKKAATEDADSSGSSHTHGVCSENEHYDDTREHCEEYCQGGPARVCFGDQNFCWCNKGYIRDPSQNCVKIEDCPKDEELKSGTVTSSGDNVFSMVTNVKKAATEDADSSGSSHTHGVCSENEHYDDTREHCEEYCQGGPARVCFGDQNFCWCNKGYIRDPSQNCVKIEDCPKDEELKSGTMTSSGDNVFSMVSNVKKAATEDADSSGSSHTHGVCSENEHYDDTREHCEEYCQGGPARVCFGDQNFCWCNKGYIRDPSQNCVKIEDCPKDEELKSGTVTSSGDNVFSMVTNVKKAATEDADSSGSSHTHGVCSENEHYDDTREHCEEYCQGGPARVCFGDQNFCWCNKGYIRDPSQNCVKIEDCPKDEELKSGTVTSSGDNVFSMVSNVKKAATEDADSSGSSHTHGVCSENEHYDDTREHCEEYCQGGPARVCFGDQNFCWCNKGYIRDPSQNCVKIEDCPKDEELKSGTVTSSGDNVFSMVSNVKKAATEDADSSRSSHTHGVCSENEHYDDTREHCEEYCQGGPARVCFGDQNFCWCNKGYIRDPSQNCVKIEDCPKDEELKSGTVTSSGDNVFSMVSNVKTDATEDADSSGSSHTHGVCSENEHYDDTREHCEEYCQGGPARVCFGYQNFCWCNKGYIRDPSQNCVKIEDCPKDEELKSGTVTSSGDNDFSKRLETVRKSDSNFPALHISLDIAAPIRQFSLRIVEDVLDSACGKTENLSAVN